MPTLQRFEEIEAWKEARELTRQIYQCSSSGDFSRDYGLRDQVRRAAVSIMSNIAEGFERDGTKEFLQFLAVAKASTGEVRSHLYVALEAGFLSQEQFAELVAHANRTSRLIAGFIRYLSKTTVRGAKYKTSPNPNASSQKPVPRNQFPETRNLKPET